MSYYQRAIHGMDPTINAAGVEASMRLQFGTLDHLSNAEFRKEIRIARACEKEQPGYLKGVAESYGMAGEFEYWQHQMEAA